MLPANFSKEEIKGWNDFFSNSCLNKLLHNLLKITKVCDYPIIGNDKKVILLKS